MKSLNTMSKYANDMIPNHLTHPGEILKDELEARKISQIEVAKKAKLTKSQVSQIVNCRRNITTEVAIKLEHALGIDAEFWLNMQSRYSRLKSLKELPNLRKELITA